MKRHLLAKSCLMGLAGLVLLATSRDSRALTVVADPNAVGVVELGNNPAFELDPFSLRVLQDPSNNIDLKSILEFLLDPNMIPSGGAITTATLELDVNIANSDKISVFGYVGDGIAEVSDAIVFTDQVGVSDEILNGDPISIVLDEAYIAGLVDAAATHLGLVLVGSANGMIAEFDNLSVKPKLILSIGTPGDFDLDGDVDGADFLKWQRGEVTSPPSASDLLDWENNYGTTTSLAAITSVPEPTTLCLILLGALGLLARGGGRRECPAVSGLQPKASSLMA